MNADERATQSRCLAFFHAEHMRALQPEPEPEQVRVTFFMNQREGMTAWHLDRFVSAAMEEQLASGIAVTQHLLIAPVPSGDATFQ